MLQLQVQNTTERKLKEESGNIANACLTHFILNKNPEIQDKGTFGNINILSSHLTI